MPKTSLNNKRIENWKTDVAQSMTFYNDWFLSFAPKTYMTERQEATKEVEEAFRLTSYLRQMTSEDVMSKPTLLRVFRMLTAPPIARDRLSGLASMAKATIETLEEGKQPRISQEKMTDGIKRVLGVIHQLLDVQLFEWLDSNREPTAAELKQAVSVISDRLCGADANPIIRNEQEHRQIAALKYYLDNKGYHEIASKDIGDFRTMPVGTYCDHLTVMVEDNAGSKRTKIPVDMVVRPLKSESYDLPVLIECKSAGDCTNTNKRQKEEAQKMQQLRDTYGNNLYYILLLCGYFDTPFQGYVASEGIDWVWEHRMEDFDALF